MAPRRFDYELNQPQRLSRLHACSPNREQQRHSTRLVEVCIPTQTERAPYTALWILAKLPTPLY